MVRRLGEQALMLAMSLMLAVGCSDEVEPNPRLRVSIFGWGPTEVGAASFPRAVDTTADTRALHNNALLE